MNDPSADIRETVRAAVALYTKMKPNTARAFETITNFLARDSRIGPEVAHEMVRKTLRGSYRAWRAENAARSHRLALAAKRGGRIN